MTTPAGLWNKGEAQLATMLSTLVPFQTFVGAANAAEALAKIYYEGMTPPGDAETGEYTLAELEALRPCAIIAAPDENAWSAQRVAEEVFVTSGKLLIIFLKSVTGDHRLPTADEITVFKNAIGPIIGKTDALEDDGLLDLRWEEPNLATRKLTCVDGPSWGDPEEAANEGVWIASTWCLEW